MKGALDPKIERWVQAGLIDAVTGERIDQYERLRRARRLKQLIMALGAPSLLTGLAFLSSDFRLRLPDGFGTAFDVICLVLLTIGIFLALLTRYRPKRGQLGVATGCLLVTMAIVGYGGTFWKYFPLESLPPSGLVAVSAFLLARGRTLTLLTLCLAYALLGTALEMPEFQAWLGYKPSFGLHPWVAWSLPIIWIAVMTLRGLWLLAAGILKALARSGWLRIPLQVLRFLARLQRRFKESVGPLRAYALELLFALVVLGSVARNFGMLSDVYQYSDSVVLYSLIGMALVLMTLITKEKPLFSAFFSPFACIEALMLGLRIRDRGLVVALENTHYAPGSLTLALLSMGAIVLVGRELTRGRLPVSSYLPLGPVGIVSCALLLALA